MANKRLFFALWPNARQRDRLRDFISPLAKLVEGRAIDRRKWHVTLAFIGDYPEERIPDLQQRVAGIEVKPFRLVFDRLEFWPRPRIASLTAATVPTELDRLVYDLTAVLKDTGVRTEDRTYRPHITVARKARAFETQRLSQRCVTEWSGFELVESVPGGGYEIVNS